MARVDVVVPCYRYGRFLRDCIGSIQRQGIPDLNILIIDDASPDDSLVIAQALAAEDSRIEVIHHPVNRGHIATYNEGIAWATSEYFMLLSADDLLVPGALPRALAVMQQRPEVSFTYGRDRVCGSADHTADLEPSDDAAEWRVSSGEEFITLLCRSAGNPVPACTAIIRTRAQKAAGPYREDLPHAGDLEMWLRLAMLGAVGATEAVQGIRRLHGANMSDGYASRMTREFRQREAAFESFFAEAGRPLPHAVDLRREARTGLAVQACRFGLSYLRQGRGWHGFELLGYALSLDPLAAARTPFSYLDRTRKVIGRGRGMGREPV